MAGVRFELPDGRVLLDDVSFRVGDGAKVALVGATGVMPGRAPVDAQPPRSRAASSSNSKEGKRTDRLRVVWT